MRKILGIVITLMLALTFNSNAQTSFSFSCARDTIVNGCANTCITLLAKVPDIHASTNGYVVNPIGGAIAPGGCFNPYVDPNVPGTPTTINADDRYSENIVLPFSFPFYGTEFGNLKISGNGYVSFDPSIAANAFSHYGICSTTGAFLGSTGTPVDLPSTLYDRALIMGAYHDINIATTTSPNRRIKYEVTGAAPHRRWIVSFYKVPNFSCNNQIENTHQIVLYEATGVVEVFVNSIENCLAWNMGRSMIGMMNFNKDQGIMAPGRKASDAPWGAINLNESWRFVPNAGPTLYRSTELYNLAGTLIATGDTTSIGNSTFQVAFPNVCSNGTTIYVVKTKYEQFNNPGSFIFSTDTVRVVAGSILSATSTSVAASCSNNGVGSATVTVTGSTSPIEYSLDGTTWQSSPVFNLPAGTYIIKYRIVGEACINETSVTIAQDPNLVAGAYSQTNVLCNQGVTGSITVTGSGGASPFEYSNDGGTTYQASGTFNNLAAGTYTIRIKDAAGCFKDTTIIITEPAVLQTTTSTVNATCSATPNGTISIASTGGTPNYAITVDGTTYPGPVVTLGDGTYSVIVTDGNGCTTTSPVTIALTNDLVIDTRTDTSLCLGNSVVLATTSNLSPNYSWTGVGLDNNTSQNPTATPIAPGTTEYIVTATLGNCTQTDVVRITSDAQVVVNAGADATITSGDQVQISATISGASTFLWTSTPTDGGLSSTTTLNPIAKPTVTTTYRLTGTNNVGCQGFDEFTITVVPYCIKVKNAFSPNGDGINDLWQVYDQFDCLRNVKVNVFNRYGSQVFESRNYRNNWDGRYNGKSLPVATYYAVIEFQLVTGKVQTVRTDLTIIR